VKDSKEYLNKKNFFDKMLTIYGRNAVLEALQDESIEIYKLHLSTSNKEEGVIKELKALANKREIEIAYHDKATLSRISKNAKQDQGVALDIILKHSSNENEFLNQNPSYRILALDRVQNPQNLGMIIRSAAAGNIDAIMLQDSNSAKISPLVIKASAGTLFKLPIIKCKSLAKSLAKFKEHGSEIYTLSSHAKESYKDAKYGKQVIWVLGNESEGVSGEIEKLSTASIAIAMNRGVESLNVAVAASLLAFL
jgi:23S rRNA (guanosine2251-2'-O)-methyltransferase